MSLENVNSTLKRLRNHYRLVIINEDTFEEIVKFKLTRMSVYIVSSTIFILMVGLTTALIVFTPLRYYLPGTGINTLKEAKALRNLKAKTDSMEQALMLQAKYLKNIEAVLKGKIIPPDTSKLSLPKADLHAE